MDITSKIVLISMIAAVGTPSSAVTLDYRNGAAALVEEVLGASIMSPGSTGNGGLEADRLPGGEFDVAVDFGLDDAGLGPVNSDPTADVFALSNIPLAEVAGNQNTPSPVLALGSISGELEADRFAYYDSSLRSFWNNAPTDLGQGARVYVPADADAMEVDIFLPPPIGSGGGSREFVSVGTPSGGFGGEGNFVNSNTVVTPLPAALWLMLSGFGGLFGLRWLRQRRLGDCHGVAAPS